MEDSSSFCTEGDLFPIARIRPVKKMVRSLSSDRIDSQVNLAFPVW